MRGANKQQAIRQEIWRRSPAVLIAGLAAALTVCGCGNQYRPVVSAISPVGPAGQPTKYAVALSNTSTYPSTTLPGLLTFVDFAGDTVLSTPSVLPFPPPTTAGSATVAPSPTFINPNTFSINSSGTEGFVVNSVGTYEDFGLTYPQGLLTQNITQTTLAAGAAPTGVQAIALPSTGTTIFVPEPGNQAISELSANGPSLLQNLSIPNPVYVVGADEALRVYALSTGAGSTNGKVYPIENSPVSLSPPITVGVNPVYGIMTPDDNRAYILNSGTSALNTGSVSVINVPGNALDLAAPTIPTLAITGYSITNNVVTFQTSIPPNSLAAGETVTLSGFGTSAFFNNQVVTVSAAGLSTTQFEAPFTHISVVTTTESGAAIVPLSHPVWTDLVTVYSEFVVLNQGDGVHPGTLSIISIPLCNANTPVTNPNCDVSNPVDAVGFGTLVATATVGVNPTMVSVLNDGSRAYVANSGILPGVNSSYPNGIEGSVSVVNLASGVVTATIPATSLPANTVNVNTTPGEIYGHPNTIAATTGTPTGKVYVTSSDNKYMTVIETDTDTVDTHISLQGLGIRVYVTQK